MTGRHTRVVWVQDAGPTACVYVEKPTVLLMGIDSDDGKGEHPIIPEQDAYYRPVLTADGQNIVYTKGSEADDKIPHSVWVVPFAGGTPKMVLPDSKGEDVWTDPDDGVTWVYAHATEKRGDTTIDTVRRYRLDQPSVSELVWDKTGVGHFQVNGDGYAGSGGNGVGQGIFRLPNDSFTSPTPGCWPSMSPDFSQRFWVFSGNHRQAGMYEPTEPGSTKFKSWPIDFSTAPGIPGNCEVYHPRWSNNIRYMTMTGPYARFDWANEAKITNEVAAGVEVYLGQFSEDLHKIDQWVQVTHNQRGDYFPDAWIEPEAGAIVKRPPPVKTKIGAVDEGLQFIFTESSGSNQAPEADGKRIRICGVKLTGATHYGSYGVIEASGGPALGSQADQVIQACQTAGAFSFSATIAPAAVQLKDPATIAAFEDPSGKADFALIQAGGRLLVRLVTNSTGPDGKTIDLGEMTPGKSLHVAVNFANGKLRCFLDGRRVLTSEDVPGDLTGWTAKATVFGADVTGASAWMGTLCDITIRSRVLDDSEAASRAAAALERAKARVPVARVVVDAVMVGHTAPADPKAIAPYVRCLSMSTYEVKNVIEGKLDAKQIAVFQWSVMDSKRVPEYEAMKVGDSRRLVLELFDDHPEQSPERQTNEVDGADALPLYYDVTFPTAPPPPASEVHWTGTDDGLWSTATSWSKAGGPSANDRVLFDAVSGKARTVTIDKPTWIGALSIQEPSASTANRVLAKAPFHIGSGTAPVLSLTGAGSSLQMAGASLTVIASNLGEIALEGATGFIGDGGVHAVHIYDGGARYTTAPKVTFAGPGTGAEGQATLSVSTVRVTHLGSGYTSAPTVTFSDPETARGRVATGVSVLNAQGALDHIDIKDPGCGYIDAPAITIEGGGGTGAGAQALCRVDGVTMISPGTGYTTQPSMTFDGGGGSGVIANAHSQQTILASTDPAGGGVLLNKGTLVQDGAFLLLDRQGAGEMKGNAGFRNEGTWTINHGGVEFRTPNGLSPDAVAPCANTGTLSLLDGSTLEFGDLTNTGTMKIGAGVKLSSSIFSGQDIAIHNNEKGTISIMGGTPDQPIIFGVAELTPNGQRHIINGAAGGAAVMEIGNGTDGTTVILTGGGTGVENGVGSRMALRHGASLKLLDNDNGAPNGFTWRAAYLSNQGTLEMGGTLAVAGNQWGPIMLDNGGTLIISGDGATFEREKDPSQGACTGAAFLTHDKGLVTGEGTFSYIDDTKIEPPQAVTAALAMPISGTIAPRNLDGKLGKPAILTFVGVDMVLGVKTWLPTSPGNGTGLPTNDFNSGGTFMLHLMGSNGECDQVVLKSGTAPTKGGSLTLNAGSGSTLDLHSSSGTIPRGSYTVITAVAINGQFEHLLYEGKDHAPYTVKYTATTVEVDFP